MEPINLLVTGGVLSGKTTYLKRLYFDDVVGVLHLPEIVTLNFKWGTINLFDDKVKLEYPIDGVILFHNSPHEFSENPYPYLPTIDVISKSDKYKKSEEELLLMVSRKFASGNLIYEISSYTNYNYEKPIQNLVKMVTGLDI